MASIIEDPPGFYWRPRSSGSTIQSSLLETRLLLEQPT